MSDITDRELDLLARIERLQRQQRSFGVVLGNVTVACLTAIVLVGTVAAIYAICSAVWG